MMTVNEVSKLSGVSVRTLHYYDQIGLLPATEVTASGYRLYDDKAMERLQVVLIYKELEFPLKDIALILDTPGFNRKKALEQQIRLLELRKEHLDSLISLANEIMENGVNKRMSFDAFSTKKIDEYAEKAKQTWGDTDAYREYEKKRKDRSSEQEQGIGEKLMDIFADFGKIKNENPDSAVAVSHVLRLKNYITDNYYECTDTILESLAEMYSAGGEMTENIDSRGGNGTALFVKRAIEAYILSK